MGSCWGCREGCVRAEWHSFPGGRSLSHFAVESRGEEEQGDPLGALAGAAEGEDGGVGADRSKIDFLEGRFLLRPDPHRLFPRFPRSGRERPRKTSALPDHRGSCGAPGCGRSPVSGVSPAVY